MGRLCAAALMDHCKDCDGAFNNGGYLRSSITYTAGTNVTFNDILNVFPFQNTISTFRMQGKWFLDVLEHSVSGYDPTDGDGKFFGAVAGFRFAWNPTAPDNSKIAIVQFYNKALKKWEDLKPQNYYKLVTNNYIRGGGDGYSMLGDKATEINDYEGSFEETMANFLIKLSPHT